jgi:hypothetical protein
MPRPTPPVRPPKLSSSVGSTYAPASAVPLLAAGDHGPHHNPPTPIGIDRRVTPGTVAPGVPQMHALPPGIKLPVGMQLPNNPGGPARRAR